MTDFTKCVSLPSDKSKLTSEDYARLGEEVLQSRREKQFSGQRLPYLPNFTGDGGTDLELYISAIESVKSTHSSQQIAQAIRRSVNGTAAKVINLLDYSATTTELVAELKKNFQRVTDTATTWQKCYAASQTSRESIMDWHIRVQHLYKMTGNRSNTDSHLKTKLYTGLFDKNLKRDVLFKYDDDNATEEDLYKLLLKRESDKSSSSISAPVVSAEDNTKKELEDLRNQLAAFKTSQKSKKKFTKEEDNHDVQLIEGEDSPSDTDDNDDCCHCAYQVSRGHQNTYKRFDKQYRGERRYPQTGYSGRYEGNKSSEQQYYKQQYPRDNRRLNQYDDRRYNQSYDRPYNQRDDHRYDQNYERRYDQSYGSQHAHHDRRYSQYYTDQPHNYGYLREDVQQSYGDPYSGQRYNSNNDGGANDSRPYYYNNHYQSKYNERSEEGRARQDFHDNKVHREDEHLMEGHQTSNGNRQHQPSHSDNSKSHEQRQKKKIHVSAPAKNKKKKSKDYTSIQRRLIGRTNTDTIEVNGIECTALIDSGSVISSMSSKFHEQQFSHIPLKPIEDVFPDGLSITSATDHELNISGYLEVNVLLPGLVTPVPILMTVLKSSILCGDMPILIGSNALESWRLELDSNKNTRDVNPVVDRWKSEPNCVGIVKNVNYAQIQSHNCLFIQSKVKVNDIRPYNRKLLFVPFEKYANTISPSTISVPKNTENISCELVTLPTKSTQCIRVPAGKKIGIMCPLKEEVLIPVNQQYNVNSSERGEELIKSFNKTSWPTEISTEIENLITDYQDVFALSHHELGCFTDAKHRIELTDRTPIKQKYRRIPPHLFEEVKTEIQKMLENGVIRPSNSPYSSPLSIAIKKDGTPRICLDFRKINNITKNDAKAIPSVDEMIDLLHGKTTFSSLDLVQGFHQQELEESSKQFTAFNAGPLGLFEYQRLPFGIKNASASFQRMMEYVLSDLLPSTCLVYIDDVIVHSYTQAEHLQSLRKVFECLRFYNLKLKPSKCEFFKTELKFLGHIISDKGLKADPDKITAIKDWPQPKSVKQIRQFLGLSGFLRRYIKDYAIIARPITDLLQGYSNKKQSRSSNLKLEKEHFVWGKDQQAAFNKLKQTIAKDVTLAFPNFDLPFKLSCDASRNGLGGWLEQVQPNGKYRPIAFASRKTSNAERQYPVHKIEFLALKWCVTEKFKDYLYGKSFVIYTDNNPLTYVLKSAKLDATSQRWLSQLEQYDFTIQYKPGVNNIVAAAPNQIYDTEEKDNFEHVQKWARERSQGFEEKERRVKEMKQSYELMSKNMDTRRFRSKTNQNDELKKTTLTFNVGDHVLVRKFIRNNKVDDRLQAEINKVLQKNDDMPLYLVKGLESGTIKNIHRDNLILFKQHTTKNPGENFDTAELWSNTRHKTYKPRDEEEFPIKKSFNGRISIHFGKLLLATDVASIKVKTSTSVEDIEDQLKSLRKDSAEKCVIYINHDNPDLIGKLLTAIRSEFHHNTWKKIVVSTKKHKTHNSLVKEMWTYFPKTSNLRQETEFSESDDNSDDEYIVVQPDINDDANNETHEGTDDDEPNSTDDDEVQPRYNLRPHRNRPAYLKDYVTFTFTPNQ